MRLAFIVVLFLLFSGKSTADQNLLFESYRDSNALYNDTVTWLFPDSFGNLWLIGPGDGVKRYDGYQSELYPLRPEKLDHITGAAVDKGGNLYLSESKGEVFIYDPSLDAFKVIDYLSNVGYHKVLSNSQGLTFIQSSDGKLSELSGDGFSVSALNLQIKNINEIHDLPDEFIFLTDSGVISKTKNNGEIKQIYDRFCTSITTIDKKNLLGCEDGVYELYKNSSANRLKKLSDIKNVTKIIRWNSDRFFLGTNESGAFLVGENFELLQNIRADNTNSSGIAANNIFSITQDPFGNYWIGTDEGLSSHRHEFQRFHRLIPTTTVNNFSVSYLAEDKTGNLWVGTHNSGLFIESNNLLKPISDLVTTEGQSKKLNNAIYSVASGSDNEMWVGTTASLLAVDTINYLVREVLFKNSHPIQNAYTILTTEHITLVGTYSDGVYLLTEDIEVRFDIVRPGNTVNEIYEDMNGNIWFLTQDGVYKADIHSLAELKSETLLIDGIFEGVSFNTIVQVTETEFWLATAGEGIFIYDDNDKAIRKIIQYPELDNNFINAIERGEHSVIVATNSGLFRINHSTYDITRFGTSDGLISDGFNNAASLRRMNDQFAFGAVKGLSLFFERDLIKPPNISKHLLKVTKQDGNVLYHGNGKPYKKVSHTIEHSDFPVSVTLKSIDLRAPSENKIRYKIGKDQKDWIEEGGSFTTSIHSLPRGENHIQLQVAGIGGWSDEIATVTLNVKPAPWLSIYAFIAYALLAILIAVLFYQWRINQLKASQRKLEATVEERTKEISDQKQKIEQQYTQLHALANEQTRFFENISHEFRTPLTLILGPINQLRADKLNDKQSQKVSVIERNAKRLLSLIEQLLEISRLNSGLKKLNPVPIELKAYVDELIFEFKAHAESINITIVNHIPDNLRIQFDSESLQRVLTNLLSNAVKYNKPNGLVEFSIIGGASETEINLVVADTGIGIAEDKLATVFDRFARIENNNQIAGTGIGLSLVKELVDANNATIAVASEPNKGTQFTLTLPLAQTEGFVEKPSTADLSNQVALSIPVTSGANEHQSFNSEQRQLLVIDDDQDMLDFVVSELPNYQCLRARDGKEGLAIALEKVPDLIVTDAMMPVMDGFELTTHLKANSVTSHIPVVILTARGSKFGRVEGLKTGADDYLTKPFDGTELNLRVENLLESRDLLKQKFAVRLTETQASSDTESPQDQFIQKLQAILQAHYFNPDFSVSNLSERMAMSDRQLQRKLKAMAGYSPSEAIRRFRLSQAQQKLRQGQRVQAVCFDVGFNSVPHFSREYKLLFGIAPSQELPN